MTEEDVAIMLSEPHSPGTEFAGSPKAKETQA